MRCFMLKFPQSYSLLSHTYLHILAIQLKSPQAFTTNSNGNLSNKVQHFICLLQIERFFQNFSATATVLLPYQLSRNLGWYQKHSRLRCLLCVKGLMICFYLGWSGIILQFRQNIIKVGSKSWLLTCSLPSYTGSALKRELFL